MNAKILMAALALATAGGAAAQAQIVHSGPPTGIIASSVVVPAGSDTIYVSGMTGGVADPSAPKGTKASLGDTETQTVGTIKRLEEELKAHGFTLGDVVMMRVYLAADPDTGKMDFAGMMKGYTQFFGTAAQPNKPARVTTQVGALVGAGALVEIEIQAAKKH
jgi:enamine deaminase RidA (YjgF/YER057c/UK114 family)